MIPPEPDNFGLEDYLMQLDDQCAEFGWNRIEEIEHRLQDALNRIQFAKEQLDTATREVNWLIRLLQILIEDAKKKRKEQSAIPGVSEE
jgi:hypothetical protein